MTMHRVDPGAREMAGGDMDHGVENPVLRTTLYHTVSCLKHLRPKKPPPCTKKTLRCVTCYVYTYVRCTMYEYYVALARAGRLLGQSQLYYVHTGSSPTTCKMHLKVYRCPLYICTSAASVCIDVLSTVSLLALLQGAQVVVWQSYIVELLVRCTCTYIFVRCSSSTQHGCTMYIVLVHRTCTQYLYYVHMYVVLVHSTSTRTSSYLVRGILY